MSSLRQFRYVAFWEGLSFVVLLFVAMPMKYLLEMPLAVRIVGSVHGVLFLLYLLALGRAAVERDWKLSRSLLLFFVSLVPFGTFLMDRSLRQELEQAHG